MTDGIQFHEEQARKLREVHRKHDEMMAGVRAVEAEKAKVAEQKRAEAEAARVAEADRRFVAGLRQRYLASDPKATQADFERDLPELRKLHRLNAVANGGTADDLARRRFATQYRG